MREPKVIFVVFFSTNFATMSAIASSASHVMVVEAMEALPEAAEKVRLPAAVLSISMR